MGRLSKETAYQLITDKMHGKNLDGTELDGWKNKRRKKVVITQEALGNKLGLSKFDINKVLHSKRKLYLNEFLTLAFELNLLSPKLRRSAKIDLFDDLTESEFYELKHRVFKTDNTDFYTINTLLQEKESLKIEKEVIYEKYKDAKNVADYLNNENRKLRDEIKRLKNENSFS